MKDKALVVATAAMLSACVASQSTEPLQLTMLPSGYVLGGTALKSEAELDAKLQDLKPQSVVLHFEPESVSYMEVQAALTVAQKHGIKIGLVGNMR